MPARTGEPSRPLPGFTVPYLFCRTATQSLCENGDRTPNIKSPVPVFAQALNPTLPASVSASILAIAYRALCSCGLDRKESHGAPSFEPLPGLS
jgi:hypothetical protein